MSDIPAANGADDAARPEILIVDDSRVIRRAAVKMLGDEYIVHEAVDGVDGWSQIQQNPALSVAFIDMQMPNMNGLELLDTIRECDDERIRNLAVIILTGHYDTEEAKQEVFDHGATDFISKPFDSLDLISRAKSYAHLVSQVANLEKQTGLDKLTGLLNVDAYLEQGAKALSFSQRHKLPLSIAHIEIDGFQNLYLNFGKAVAQQIIRAIGKKLQSSLRVEDIAARTGVAKYALILPATNKLTTAKVIERLQQLINKLVFDTGSDKIRASLVIGVSTPDNGADIRFEEIVEQADAALAQAVARADKRLVFFESPASESAEVFSEQDMHQAMNNILLGDFEQIPAQHLRHVMQRLQPFIDYVANQQESDLTGTGV